jgi:hypothetical protein
VQRRLDEHPSVRQANAQRWRRTPGAKRTAPRRGEVRSTESIPTSPSSLSGAAGSQATPPRGGGGGGPLPPLGFPWAGVPRRRRRAPRRGGGPEGARAAGPSNPSLSLVAFRAAGSQATPPLPAQPLPSLTIDLGLTPASNPADRADASAAMLNGVPNPRTVLRSPRTEPVS